MADQKQRGPTSDTERRPLAAILLGTLIVVCAGIATYWNSFDGVFLYDDIVSIRDNPHIRNLWPLRSAISVPLWSTGATVDHRPVLSMSFALNHALFGDRPPGYHAVNLLVHIATGLVLLGIVRRTLLLARPEQFTPARALTMAVAVAVVWLVHPFQTHSVTYMVQRAESMMGLFYLTTLYCAIRASQSPRAAMWNSAAVAACALGMGTKEIMITAPIMVVLFDRVFLYDATAPRPRYRWILYASLAATWAILASLIWLAREDAVRDFTDRSPPLYAATQPGVILYYLRLSAWPDPLVLDYNWPHPTRIADTLIPGVVVGLLALVAAWGVWRRQWYGFVGAWFFLILAPTSSIVALSQRIQLHRMYLPLAAVVVLAVIALDVLLREASGTRVAVRWSVAAGTVLLGVVFALGWQTLRHNSNFHSRTAIWEHNVTERPKSAVAQYNLAVALHDLGRSGDSIAHYQEALRIKPGNAEAHNNLGVALHDLRRSEDSIVHYQEALRIEPDHSEAHNNWGLALYGLGRPEDSIAQYQEALRIKPDHAETHNNLGLALKKMGRVEEAVAHYQEALRIKPDYAKAHNNLGRCPAEIGTS